MLACKCNERAAEPKDSVSFVRVIHKTLCEQMDYTRENAPKTTHLGQMKLLLSEIEFLTPFFNQPYWVIYAGAAPGVHIPILAGMFSTMHFVLVDPQWSMISKGEYANIDVVQELMTDELAREYASIPNLLFISDVRVGPPPGGESDSAQQERIQRDMVNQRRWLELMCPLASMLKFRLPWCIGVTNYLSGRIYFPVYGKHLTHESRLIVKKGEVGPMDYDNRLYEGHMAYFNWMLRPAIYSAFGGGRCYDCTAFRWIVCKYLAASEQLDLENGFNASDYSAIDERCLLIEAELNRLKSVFAERVERR
jgi:hypothetical protein